MPGSGKSVIAHAVAEIFRRRGLEASEPSRTTDRLPSGIHRRLAKSGVAVREGLAQRGEALNGLRTILGSSQSGPAGYPLSVLNWFYLAGLYRAASQHSGITLLDQGLMQAVWSVEFGSDDPRGQPASDWADLAGQILLPLSVVVFVDVDDTTLTSRLARRPDGMSRLDAAMASSNDEFERALARGRDALDYVDKVAGQLTRDGRIRSVRVDSGSADPEALARAVVSELRLD